MKRTNIQKTPLSFMFVFRFFGYDFLFGYIKIREAVEMGDENANIVMERSDGHKRDEL